MAIPEDYRERLSAYMQQRQLTVVQPLGAGTQGSVFLVANLRQTQLAAVKFHHREVAFFREVDVFQRLTDLEIEEVRGHMVPQLIGYDDKLLAIEMTTVSPPFVLDFGGAYLDQPPDYSEEVWEDWRRMKSDAFEENWPEVEEILDEFRSFGVYIADVNTSNIRF